MAGAEAVAGAKAGTWFGKALTASDTSLERVASIKGERTGSSEAGIIDWFAYRRLPDVAWIS